MPYNEEIESDKDVKNKKKLTFIGLLCLAIYALTQISYNKISGAAEVGFLVTGLIIIYKYHREILFSIYFKLFLLAVVVQLIPWFISHFEYMPAVDGFPDVRKLGKLFLFIPAAVILLNKPNQVFYLWGCAAVGLFYAVFIVNPMDWIRGFDGERVDFSIRNAQHAAMFFGVLLLAGLCFFKRIVNNFNIKLVGVFISISLVVIAEFGIYVTQTRSIFIATPVALVAMFVILFFLKNKNYIVTLAGIAIVVLSISLVKPIIEERTKSESAVAGKVLSGEFNGIEYTSIGIRVNTWLEAIHKIEKRPFFGWGENAKKWVIEQSAILPDWVKKDFRHLHNYPLEIQISYGLLGTMWLVFLFLSLANISYDAWCKKTMPLDVYLFCNTFFVYFIIVNLFESYLSYRTGIFMFNIVATGIVVFSYKNKHDDFL